MIPLRFKLSLKLDKLLVLYNLVNYNEFCQWIRNSTVPLQSMRAEHLISISYLGQESNNASLISPKKKKTNNYCGSAQVSVCYSNGIGHYAGILGVENPGAMG